MQWNKLEEGLKDLNLDIDVPYEKFDQYTEFLLEWNQKINLTRITQEDEIQIKHFLDSLSPLLLPYFQKSAKILDLGSGAGFPGMVLALVLKDRQVYLMDSLNKRVKFLQGLIDELAIEDAYAIHGRGEEMARDPKYRENFDICIARAVARLNILVEYCLPFVRTGGHFIAMKAEDGEEELKEGQKAIEKLGGKLVNEKKFQLLNQENRHLIVIEKIKPTPMAYPRAGGKPRKNPL